MSRKRGPVETPEYRRMVGRMIKAHGRRVGAADIEDLADMLALQTELDMAMKSAVDGLREQGYSWADIARATGKTRQAAQQRWGTK